MTQPTSLRLEEPELQRIRRLAASTRRKQSDLLRYALELGLDQIERDTNRRAERTTDDSAGQ